MERHKQQERLKDAMRSGSSRWRAAEHARPSGRGVASSSSVVGVVVLPYVVVGTFVFYYFHPQISIDFLFLYFGIASALAVGAWSTLVLSETKDTAIIYVVSTTFNLAAFAALIAMVLGPSGAANVLDFSVTSLTVGMATLLYHSYTYLGSERTRRPPAIPLTSTSDAPKYECSICHRVFSSPKEVDEHSRTEHWPK